LLDGAPPFPAVESWTAPLGTVTPAGLYAAHGPGPYRLLIESTLAGGQLGPYSVLTGDPLLILWHRAGQTFVHVRGSGTTRAWAGDPFVAVKALLAHYHETPLPVAAVPFPAGVAGFWGYGLRGWVEPRLRVQPDPRGLPECLLGLYPNTLTIDHVTGTLTAIGPPQELAAWRAAALEDSSSRDMSLSPGVAALVAASAVGRNFDPATYAAAVGRVLDHIVAGDIYQVNLSQRFTVPCPDDAWTVYRRLRAVNPAPFAAYMPWPGAALVSASPERFLQTDGQNVWTRPIKGTRPRGATPAEDARLAAELQASEKDRAENVMIVDLMRNDLGRVCTLGSVRVPELLALESYATVHHLVSTVTGHLAPGHDAVDLLRACWPGGSITGAPKIRAMEIIADLEPQERGPYCGSIGYISLGGQMDTSILIRTMVVHDGVADVDAGGGIVADSDPRAEYDETLAKAAALLRVLGVDPATLDDPA
jgi:para-aminobenzoate synthetase component 1